MDPKSDLSRIAEAALESVDPGRMVSRCLRLEGGVLHVQTRDVRREVDLSSFSRIFLLGFGKAAGPMARAVEEVLGNRIDKGLIVVKPGHETPLRFTRQVFGGHPVPDEASVRAAGEVAAVADEADARTLVITLISGGGSSLLAAPMAAAAAGEAARTAGAKGATGAAALTAGSALALSDIQETTRQLLACGADIAEINCIRKHLLLLAGGKLARRIAPAASLSLVLSDVVGDDLQTIASGPTSADSTTYEQALSIIRRYGIDAALPKSVLAFLTEGAAGKIPETPKPGAPELAGASSVLVGTNLVALHAAADRAASLRYHTLIYSSRLVGEARDAARVLAGVAKDAAAGRAVALEDAARRDAAAGSRLPACILAGGETTVTLRGSGKGGRNQEMAVSFLREIENEPVLLSRSWFLSFSTDGEDGPTDAAGGFADAVLADAVRAAGLRIEDYLAQNDSYNLLRRIGGLFVTGPTNTNVCDVQILLVL